MRKRKGALLRISIEIETTKKSLFYLLAQSVSVYPTSNVGTLVMHCIKMYALADAPRGYARVIPRDPTTIRLPKDWVDNSASPNRPTPPCGFGFLGCTEPSPAAALIHFNFGVKPLVLYVINPLTVAFDVSLDRTISVSYTHL